MHALKLTDFGLTCLSITGQIDMHVDLPLSWWRGGGPAHCMLYNIVRRWQRTCTCTCRPTGRSIYGAEVLSPTDRSSQGHPRVPTSLRGARGGDSAGQIKSLAPALDLPAALTIGYLFLWRHRMYRRSLIGCKINWYDSGCNIELTP